MRGGLQFKNGIQVEAALPASCYLIINYAWHRISNLYDKLT